MHRIELITYISYSNAVKGRIIPYSRDKGITLLELKPHHIQDFYSYALNEWGVSANTVIHYHAIIRSALQQAFITDRIPSNPADKIIRPKKELFVGSSYSASEVNQLLEIAKGTRIELAVMLGAFYGLRRSEVVGLKWSAIDLVNKTITIRQTVTFGSLEWGAHHDWERSDKKQGKSPYSPLVDAFYDLLLQLKEQQEINQQLFKDSYCKDYIGHIYVDIMGERIKPNHITQHLRIFILTPDTVPKCLQPIMSRVIKI